MQTAPASSGGRRVSRKLTILSMSDSQKTPELTAEQQHALDAQDDVVQGSSFVLLCTDVVLNFFGYDAKEELQRKLQAAFDEADRGELAEWNVEEFLARMHQQRDSAAE